MKKDENNRSKQIEEMTSVWSIGDDYVRGYLNGVIEAVTHMACRNEMASQTATGKAG